MAVSDFHFEPNVSNVNSASKRRKSQIVVIDLQLGHHLRIYFIALNIS